MKLLLGLLLTTQVFASTEIDEAKKSIMTLIRPLIGETVKKPKGTEKFRVDGCEKKKIDWMDVILGKDSANMEYTFKDGCDIQGKIKLRVLKEFPLDLALRNLQSYDHVKTTNMITAELQRKPILNLDMRDGLLTGKHTVKFEVDYKVRVKPGSKKAIDKNMGGELRITEIDGKKADIREKIYVK